MAEKFFSISIGHGADPRAVTVGNTTAGTAIELRVTVDATGMDKLKIHNALITLQQKLTALPWPIS